MSRQTTALDAERHARRAYDAASRIVDYARHKLRARAANIRVISRRQRALGLAWATSPSAVFRVSETT
jgi:hypothetical protein